MFSSFKYRLWFMLILYIDIHVYLPTLQVFLFGMVMTAHIAIVLNLDCFKQSSRYDVVKLKLLYILSAAAICTIIIGTTCSALLLKSRGNFVV